MTWFMRMSWHNLAFLHWPVDAATLEARIPPSLTLDVFEGQAWLGVVPFRMVDVGPRGFPTVGPWSEFLELNVRTYVRVGDQRGVFFFSLDAESRFAVRAARRFFHLPYFDAEMECAQSVGSVRGLKRSDGVDGVEAVEAVEGVDRVEAIEGVGGVKSVGFDYSSRRTHSGAPPGEFRASYRPTGPVYSSNPGSLDEFLTERYCLYSVDPHGDIWRGDIRHPRWPLQPASVEVDRVDLGTLAGCTLDSKPPLVHYSEALDVVAWVPRRV